MDDGILGLDAMGEYLLMLISWVGLYIPGGVRQSVTNQSFWVAVAGGIGI